MVGRTNLGSALARYIILTGILAVMIFPLLWMFRVAFLPANQPVGLLSLLQGAVTLDNFGSLLFGGLIVRPFLNSLFVVLIVTAGNIFFCFMVGYTLARYRSLGNRLLFLTVVVVLMIPVHVIIIPLYILTVTIGIFDSYWALILPFLVQPIGIFLVKQYVESIPPSMEEAARIDGAGEMTILLRIVMPMCKPALAVLAIQIFFTNWNSFLLPFILTSRSDLQTLPVALAMLQGHQAIEWPHLMAGAAIAVLPVLAIFLLMQRQIISGITAGAVRQ